MGTKNESKTRADRASTVAPAAKNKSASPLLSIFWAGNWHKIGSFFCLLLLYHLLIHKSKQKNTNILAQKFVIFHFVYIFSVFFPPKARVRTTQRKNATAE